MIIIRTSQRNKPNDKKASLEKENERKTRANGGLQPESRRYMTGPKVRILQKRKTLRIDIHRIRLILVLLVRIRICLRMRYGR